MEDIHQALNLALHKLLRPLARIMLRHGMSFGQFMEQAKQVFVETAVEDFTLPGRKQTDSRIAVITGLTRKEVKIVRARGSAAPPETTRRYNRAARVISGWVQDRSYQDGWGEPAILPFEGEGPSFTRLVTEYGADVPVRATLDELLRVNTVERLKDGRIKLLQRAYIPNSSAPDKLDILGTDAALLIQTIEHNLSCEPGDSYYQRKVAYDNLPVEAIPVLREKAAEQGQTLLEALNTWLLTQDRDANPDVRGSGRKHAGVGVYFFEHDYQEEEQS